jgi:hypothetical protein
MGLAQDLHYEIVYFRPGGSCLICNTPEENLECQHQKENSGCCDSGRNQPIGKSIFKEKEISHNDPAREQFQ